MVTPRRVADRARRADAPPEADRTILPLTETVRWSVDLLGDLHAVHADVRSGELERRLRIEIARMQDPRVAHGSGHERPALAGLRTACAHLSVRAYEDAYLALVQLQELLPSGSDRGTGDI